MGGHEELRGARAEGPVVSKVESREGNTAGMAGRQAKGGELRAQSDEGMTGPLLCCEMVRGEVQCAEKQNDGTEDI